MLRERAAGNFRCKLCGSTSYARAYLLQEPSDVCFAACECSECGLFQSIYEWLSAPSLQITERFDNRDANWRSTEEFSHLKEKGMLFAKLLDEAGHLKGARILDIGCGQGWFLRACLDLGALHAAGEEYRNADIRFAKKRLGICDIRSVPLERQDVWTNDEFDVVCSFDVIEHVHDLRQFFDQCLRVTRPGGIVFHAFPGYDSLSHLAGRRLAKLGVRTIATTLCNLHNTTDLGRCPHVQIPGYRQVKWLEAHHALNLMSLRYISHYSYSDQHYASMLPLLNRFPEEMGKSIFRICRKMIRNKLVFLAAKK